MLIFFLSLLFLPLASWSGSLCPAAHAQLVLHDGDLAAAFRFREVFGFHLATARPVCPDADHLHARRAVCFPRLGYFACFIGIFVTIFVAQLFQYHLIGQLCWYDRTVLTAPQRGE